MDNSGKIKREYSQKVIDLFAVDSWHARNALMRKTHHVLSQCTSQSLQYDVIGKSFKEMELRFETNGAFDRVFSDGDSLVEDINKITEGMLTSPNLVILGNQQMTVGHALEITMSELQRDKVVAIFSMRESAIYYGLLLLGLQAGVPLSNIEAGAIEDKMWPQLTQAVGYLSEGKLFINDKKDICIEEIRDEVVKLKRIYGHLDLIFVDKLEDFLSNSKGEDTVMDLLENFRTLAKEQKMLVVVLTQQEELGNLAGMDSEGEQTEPCGALQKGIKLYADFAYTIGNLMAPKGTAEFKYYNLQNETSGKISYFSKHLNNFAAYKGLIRK